METNSGSTPNNDNTSHPSAPAVFNGQLSKAELAEQRKLKRAEKVPKQRTHVNLSADTLTLIDDNQAELGFDSSRSACINFLIKYAIKELKKSGQLKNT